MGPDSPLGPLRPLGPSGPSSPRGPSMPASPYNTQREREREWCPDASVWETKTQRKIYLNDDDVFSQSSSPGLLWFPYLPWNLGNHPHPKIDRNELLHLPAIVWLFHYIVVEGILCISDKETFFPPFHWDLINSPDRLYLLKLNMWITGSMLPSAGWIME